MKKGFFGVLTIVLILGLTLAGCDNVINLDPEEPPCPEVLIPLDAKAGGSGAGYAGWAYDEELFPRYNGSTNPFQWIEHNGVVRTGGAGWQMAVGFQSPAFDAEDPDTQALMAQALSLEDYLNGLSDNSIEGGRLIKVGGGEPIYEKVPPLVPPLVYPLVPPMITVVPPYVPHMVDDLGYTDDEVLMAKYAADGYSYTPKWKDGETGYGGWAKSDDFPNEPGAYYDGVYRPHNKWTDMAITYQGENQRIVDLISGQDKVVGKVYIEREVGSDTITVTLKGLTNDKDRGVINHISMYTDWKDADDPMKGEGNWNGNIYHNQGAAYFTYNPDETVYIFVKGKVDSWLGYWGKIGEHQEGWDPVLDAPNEEWTIVEGETDDPYTKQIPNENAPKEEWVRDEDGELVSDYTAPKDQWVRDEDADEEDWVFEQVGSEEKFAYALGVDIIEGQDHKIGKFVIIDAYDGDLSLAWVFYFPKSKASHIQYMIMDNPKDIGDLGNGQWLENKNIPQNEFGFYSVTVAPESYESGEKIYVAAHCSN